MSQLPYWFTNEDKANPVHCRACKQHIPRAIFSAGHGLCPNCLSRVSSRSGEATETIPSTARVQAPAYTVPAAATAPLAKANTPPQRVAVSAPTIAVLILLAGLIVGAARLALHI